MKTQGTKRGEGRSWGARETGKTGARRGEGRSWGVRETGKTGEGNDCEAYHKSDPDERIPGFHGSDQGWRLRRGGITLSRARSRFAHGVSNRRPSVRFLHPISDQNVLAFHIPHPCVIFVARAAQVGYTRPQVLHYTSPHRPCSTFPRPASPLFDVSPPGIAPVRRFPFHHHPCSTFPLPASPLFDVSLSIITHVRHLPSQHHL